MSDEVDGPAATVEVDHDSRARTHLANERTFLAWFRTGWTMVALGLAAAQFLAPDPTLGVPLVPALATLLALAGMLIAVVGTYRYAASRTRIDLAAFRPANRSVGLATAAALLLGGLAVIVIWLLRPI